MADNLPEILAKNIAAAAQRVIDSTPEEVAAMAVAFMATVDTLAETDKATETTVADFFTDFSEVFRLIRTFQDLVATD